MGNGHLHAVEWHSLLSEINTTSGYHCLSRAVWLYNFIFQMWDYQEETSTGELILQIPTSLSLTSHYEVTNTDKHQPQCYHLVNSEKSRQLEVGSLIRRY